MSARYHEKRAAGLSPIRSDGSITSAENDRQSAAAEEFAARELDAEFNGDVYARHGDGGHDFTVIGPSGTSYTVEVVWLGFRSSGHLIVNPHESHRWADLYVVVSGSVQDGFRMVGWMRHGDLVARPKKDFGYGPRFAAHIDDLSPFKGKLKPKRDTLWYVNAGRKLRGAAPLTKMPSFYDPWPEPEIDF